MEKTQNIIRVTTEKKLLYIYIIYVGNRYIVRWVTVSWRNLFGGHAGKGNIREMRKIYDHNEALKEL